MRRMLLRLRERALLRVVPTRRESRFASRMASTSAVAQRMGAAGEADWPTMFETCGAALSAALPIGRSTQGPHGSGTALKLPAPGAVLEPDGPSTHLPQPTSIARCPSEPMQTTVGPAPDGTPARTISIKYRLVTWRMSVRMAKSNLGAVTASVNARCDPSRHPRLTPMYRLICGGARSQSDVRQNLVCGGQHTGFAAKANVEIMPL